MKVLFQFFDVMCHCSGSRTMTDVGAVAADLFSEQELTCSICLDLFSDPVSTPCGHNFCQVVCHTCLTAARSACRWFDVSSFWFSLTLVFVGVYRWLLGLQLGLHLSALQASVRRATSA